MEQSVESAGYRLTRDQFERFQKLVYERSGIALRPEKQQMLCSRLAKRLRQLRLASFDEYYALVTDAPGSGEELEQLLNALTTNKTSFFREAHHFEELRARLIEPLARQAPRDTRLRVWSAGCSTGEEPYSILMTVCEALPSWEAADVRVLASDLDSEVLSVGERGVYAEERVGELGRELRQRWFIDGTGAKAGFVRVRRGLRERVAFRRFNFIDASWPIRVRFDAIFCRNALIYFDAPTQRAIVAKLLSYLAPGGYLFLGHAESTAGVRPDLKSLGRTAYQYLGPAP